MLLKQVIPLLLLYADEDKCINGRTRFQKMIFMAQKEGKDVKEWYSFFPHDFGPYSIELQEDLDYLKKEELIEELPEHYGDKIRYKYHLTVKGNAVIYKVLKKQKYKESLMPILKSLQSIMNQYRDSPLESLINDVYKKHPDYAIFSKFIND